MRKHEKLVTSALAATLLGLGISSTALAHEQGDWLMRFGAVSVDPTSDNHDIVDVDSAWGLGLNFTYMATNHFGVELLAAWPFEHDISLVGGGKVASTKQLPPTLSLQYHFAPSSKLQPYVGVGVNYTDFFDEKTTGALQGSNLSLDSSWGWAFDAGLDIMLDEKWFLNLDVRYIDISTDASLDNASIGEVKIDPMVYGAYVGFRF
jgi:outer membrane protein